MPMKADNSGNETPQSSDPCRDIRFSPSAPVGGIQRQYRVPGKFELEHAASSLMFDIRKAPLREKQAACRGNRYALYDVEKRLIIIMLHSIIRVIPRLLPLSILAVSLASCDNNSGCYGCYNGPPTEFSAGVVSADFNGDGFADVVALSTVFPPSGQTPSNVKAYLSTAAGTFAAPAYTADGFNPIYLASADLNGDGLMDLV